MENIHQTATVDLCSTGRQGDSLQLVCIFMGIGSLIQMDFTSKLEMKKLVLYCSTDNMR
jgi:hypothetical protein